MWRGGVLGGMVVVLGGGGGGVQFASLNGAVRLGIKFVGGGNYYVALRAFPLQINDACNEVKQNCSLPALISSVLISRRRLRSPRLGAWLSQKLTASHGSPLGSRLRSRKLTAALSVLTAEYPNISR